MNYLAILAGVLAVIVLILAYRLQNVSKKDKPCEVCKVCEKLPEQPECPVCEECPLPEECEACPPVKECPLPKECPECPPSKECEECPPPKECDDCSIYHQWKKDSVIPKLLSNEFTFETMEAPHRRRIRFKVLMFTRSAKTKTGGYWGLSATRLTPLMVIAIQEKRGEEGVWQTYPYTYTLSHSKDSKDMLVAMPYEAIHILETSDDEVAKQRAQCIINKARITFVTVGHSSVSMQTIDQLKFTALDCLSANLPKGDYELNPDQNYRDLENTIYMGWQKKYSDILYM